MKIIQCIVILCLIENSIQTKWTPIKITEKPYVVAIKTWISDLEALRECYKEKRFLTKKEYDDLRSKITEDKLVVLQTGTLISPRLVITSASIYYNWQTLQIPFHFRNKESIETKEFHSIKPILQSFWSKMFVFAGTEINVVKESDSRSSWRKILRTSLPNLKRIVKYPELFNVAVLTIEPFELSPSIQIMKNVKWFKKNEKRNLQSCETVGFDSKLNILVKKQVNPITFEEDQTHKYCVDKVSQSKADENQLDRIFCVQEEIIREGLDTLGYYGAPLLCHIADDPTLMFVALAVLGNVKGTLYVDLNFTAKLNIQRDEPEKELPDPDYVPILGSDDDTDNLYFDKTISDELKDYLMNIRTSTEQHPYPQHPGQWDRIGNGKDHIKGYYGAPLLCHIADDPTLMFVALAVLGNVQGTLYLDLNFTAKMDLQRNSDLQASIQIFANDDDTDNLYLGNITDSDFLTKKTTIPPPPLDPQHQDLWDRIDRNGKNDGKAGVYQVLFLCLLVI